MKGFKTFAGLTIGVGLVLAQVSQGDAQSREARSVKLGESLPTQNELSACSSDLYCSKLRLSLGKQSDLTRLLFITDPSALAGVPEVGGLIQGVMRELPGLGSPLGAAGEGVQTGSEASGLSPSGFGMLDLVRKVTLGDFAQDHGWDSQGSLQINGPRRGGSYAENEGGEPAGGESSPDAGQSTPDDPSGDGGTSASGSTGSDGGAPTGGGDPNSPEKDWQYDWSYVNNSANRDTPQWSCCENGSSFAPGWMFPVGDPRYQPIVINRPGNGGPVNDVDSSMAPRPSAEGLFIQTPKVRVQPGVTDPAYRPTQSTAVKGDQTPDGATGGRPITQAEKKAALGNVRFLPGRTAGAIRPVEGEIVGTPSFTGTPRPAPVGCDTATGACPTR